VHVELAYVQSTGFENDCACDTDETESNNNNNTKRTVSQISGNFILCLVLCQDLCVENGDLCLHFARVQRRMLGIRRSPSGGFIMRSAEGGCVWARSSQRSAFGEEALEEGLQQTREGLSLYFQLSLSALQLSSFTLESSSSTVVHKRGSGTGQGGQRLRITSKTGDRARLALRSLGLSEFLIYLPDAYLRQLMNRGTRIGEKSSK